MGTVIALLLVAAFSMTVFASEEMMTGPDEVVEGSNISVEFTSPQGGGMEGTVTASDNLSFQDIVQNNMGAQLSSENHVFSLFGDPVEYVYNVTASAGEEVSVSLTDAEVSDADANLSKLDDQTWSAQVQPSQTARPTSDPTATPTGNPSTQPTPTSYPTGNPTGQPTASQTVVPTAPDQPSNPNTPGNPPQKPFRYPTSYRPLPAAQRTVYRSNDGMPKTGDSTGAMNYWALLSVAALLGVVVIISATQVCSFGDKREARVSTYSQRYYRR